MGPEAKFWQRLLRLQRGGQVLGYWERVEVKLPTGFPDTVVEVSGRTIFVELKHVEQEKDLKRELRPDQALWIDKRNRMGGEAYVLAYIASERQMVWYSDSLNIRKGLYRRTCVPTGVYSPQFRGVC